MLVHGGCCWSLLVHGSSQWFDQPNSWLCRSGGGLDWEMPNCQIQCPELGGASSCGDGLSSSGASLRSRFSWSTLAALQGPGAGCRAVDLSCDNSPSLRSALPPGPTGWICEGPKWNLAMSGRTESGGWCLLVVVRGMADQRISAISGTVTSRH